MDFISLFLKLIGDHLHDDESPYHHGNKRLGKMHFRYSVNFQTFCSQTKFRIVCLSAAKTDSGAGGGTALLLRDQYTQHNNIPATATHHSKQPQVLQIQMDFGVLIVT